MKQTVVISGSGLTTPKDSISNIELVESFNSYVQAYNAEHAADIASGKLEALLPSDVAFIEKASGIKNRYVLNKQGILDPQIMRPILKPRSDDELSLQAELSVQAAKSALKMAHKSAADVDMVIVSCTNMQRPYPAISIEVQNALGINGHAYDMGAACSSATFGIQAAYNAIINKQAKCVLVITPEMMTPQVNFRDRQSHFIFGDAITALIIEAKETSNAEHAFEILGSKLKTQFSNNVRCNFGYMNRSENNIATLDKLFYQQGKKVFKEVIPFVEAFVTQHLAEHNIAAPQLKRLWLHQANSNMNRLIATKILGHEPTIEEAPVVLAEYANTGSAGSIIAFHKYNADFKPGELGLICSFGAGYSVGNIIVRKI